MNEAILEHGLCGVLERGGEKPFRNDIRRQNLKVKN